MKALLWLFVVTAAPIECFVPAAVQKPIGTRLSRIGTAHVLRSSSLSLEEQRVVEDGVASSIETPNTVQPNVDAMVNTVFMGGTVFLVLAYLCFLNSGIWHGWTAEEILTRIPIDAWFHYSGTLAENPIATKACTSATVYTIGDIIAQKTQGVCTGELDRNRILRSLAAGLIGHGPLSHYWYDICDGFFDNVLLWTAWWVFLPKVFVDQLLWGPFWNNTYILMLGVMKGDNVKGIWEDVKRTTVPLVISGLKLWPAAHLVTYGLVPVENRLLWVDLVEILWVTILATQASGHKVGEPSVELLSVDKPAE